MTRTSIRLQASTTLRRQHGRATSSTPAPATSPRTGSGATVRIGVDIGGTKTHIATVAHGGRNDDIIPTSTWRSHLDDILEEDMARLARLVNEHITPSHKAAVCLGMHGCDTEQQLRNANHWLASRINGTALAINDAELVGHAAGLEHSISLILGTGAVSVGRTKNDEFLRADGYGWLLGDYGSAPALIRDAVTALMHHAITDGEDNAERDPLYRLLASHFHTHSIIDLALAFTASAGETAWGSLAPILFDAHDAKSPIAEEIIGTSIDHIVESILSVKSRGAIGETVVAAGGVITHQPSFAQRIATTLNGRTAGALTMRILDGDPVDGALTVAGKLTPKIRRAAEPARK